MRSRHNINNIKAVFILFVKSITFVLLLLLSQAAHAQNETLTVISNEKGAPPQLKFTELRSILRGEKQRWRNGNKITIALMKTNTPTGAYTCKKIYDMSGDELKKFWLALVFEGRAEAPMFFNSVAEVESFVADNPGAIGIVDQPVTSADMHVVLIDGKRSL
jgi:hypothetical protein